MKIPIKNLDESNGDYQKHTVEVLDEHEHNFAQLEPTGKVMCSICGEPQPERIPITKEVVEKAAHKANEEQRKLMGPEPERSENPYPDSPQKELLDTHMRDIEANIRLTSHILYQPEREEESWMKEFDEMLLEYLKMLNLEMAVMRDRPQEEFVKHPYPEFYRFRSFISTLLSHQREKIRVEENYRRAAFDGDVASAVNEQLADACEKARVEERERIREAVEKKEKECCCFPENGHCEHCKYHKKECLEFMLQI